MHAQIAALVFGRGVAPPPNIEARYHQLTLSTTYEEVLGADPRRLSVIVSSDNSAAVKVRFSKDSNSAPTAQLSTTLGPLTFNPWDHFVLPSYPLWLAAVSGTPVAFVTELRLAE